MVCLFLPKSVNQNDFWKNLALCFQVLYIQIQFKNSIGPCQILSIYCQQMVLIKAAPVPTHTLPHSVPAWLLIYFYL